MALKQGCMGDAIRSLTDCGRAYPSAECGAVSDQAGERTEGPGYKTTRMEAFSDGVFAIAITLLVLEIGIPSGSEHDLLTAVLAQWPSYLAYLVR
jgi:Endosomal/lysosomal potassium channel TMEM175